MSRNDYISNGAVWGMLILALAGVLGLLYACITSIAYVYSHLQWVGP